MAERYHPPGPLHYYHRESTREIWAYPEYPAVVEERTNSKMRSRQRLTGWTALAEVEHIRADNWRRPDLPNQWHYRTTDHHRQPFDSKDGLADVRRLFQVHHGPPADAVEISRDEYEKLKEKYEEIARANPPPNPLPPFVL